MLQLLKRRMANPVEVETGVKSGDDGADWMCTVTFLSREENDKPLLQQPSGHGDDCRSRPDDGGSRRNHSARNKSSFCCILQRSPFVLF